MRKGSFLVIERVLRLYRWPGIVEHETCTMTNALSSINKIGGLSILQIAE